MGKVGEWELGNLKYGMKSYTWFGELHMTFAIFF